MAGGDAATTYDAATAAVHHFSESDGTLYLDTYPVTMSELEARLTSFYAADPNLPIVIKGDATVQYQLVIYVLDMAGRIGITHIGLVTQKLVK